MSLSLKKRIGDFQIGKTIGEGAFGKVHKGVHLPTGKQVAIKVLEKEKITEKQDLDRVHRQLTILKKLNHPHIITLLQLHETLQNIYIVTEYVKGKELYHRIVQEENLSEKRCLHYFSQLLDAITYLHSNKICHRDIKPENILVSGNHLKIIDFGLSKEFGQSKLLGTSCGSPCYAAPQMLTGKKYDATKTDVWALGVTLYAMIAGRLPFEHERTERLYQLVNEGRYDRILNISKGLESLIGAMLQVNPNLRISTKQIKESRWMRNYRPEAKNNEKENQLLIDSMCQLFGYEREKMNRIIEGREIPSLFTYYYLMKNGSREMMLNAQTLESHRGNFHLQFVFSSLKDVDGWLKEKAKGFEYIGKYGIEYKGQKVRVKRIEGLNMYYLDMPTYFTF